MNKPPEDTELRLLYVLHRGLVEIRLLAGSNRNQQAFDLADALELIPGMIKNWHEGDMEQIRSLFRTYHDKYPAGGFDFLVRLGDKPPLDF